MSQCKAYKQLTTIHDDTYVGVIPVNCGNCQRWLIDNEKCREEIWVKEWVSYLLEGTVW